MQHPSTFRQSFVTRCTVMTALIVLGGDTFSNRCIIAPVMRWYLLQLEWVFAGEQASVKSFDGYLKAGIRVRIALALMYLVAVQPSLILCGLASAFLWPCYVLLVSMMQLKHLFLR